MDGRMKIITAERAGFCFGVKRAVNLAFRIAKKKSGGVYTLGPIIHNPQVVKRLEEVGVEPVNNIRDLRNKNVNAVIIRTHGITAREMDWLKNADYEIIDATCPFVKKAQDYAKLLREEGYKVVILGDSDHPEVKGLRSYAGRGVRVVKGSDDISSIKGRIGIVVQTTQQVETLRKLLYSVVGNVTELKVYNTICSSTALRLKETEETAKSMDVMIIVGGKNSANTTQLASLCRDMGVQTHHIETAREIRRNWFQRAEKVFITAGASTPDWIIKEIEIRIEDIGGRGR
jgi:4-hydroxy-3-methylbut-2-enyl diphosphate reductase